MKLSGLEVLMVDKRIIFVSLVGYCLMIIVYTLDLVEKYNMIVGLMISIFTISFILFILKYFLTNKEISQQEESPTNDQIIGTDVRVEDDLTFKNIKQSYRNKSLPNKQIIGTRIKAREAIFSNIQQKK